MSPALCAVIDPRLEPKGLLEAGADADSFHEDDDFGPNGDGFAIVMLAASFIIPGDTETPAGISSDDVAVVLAVIDTEAAAGAGAAGSFDSSLVCFYLWFNFLVIATL